MSASLLFALVGEENQPSIPEYRKRVGNFAAGVGVIINLLLFAAKLFAGMVTHSIAVIGDAFNNLSDAGTSALTFLSFYFTAKPPDEDHPFGHARSEYLFSALAGMLILFVGLQLGLESIDKIRNPVEPNFHALAFVLLVTSIFGKLFLFFFYRYLGARIDSSMLAAAATDSLADILSSSAIILSLLVGVLFQWHIDGWMGLIVSLIILKAGYGILKDTIDKLLGSAPPASLKSDIENFVLDYPGIHDVHDLIVHDYGPGRTLASIHAEVNVKDGFMQSHSTVDKIEQDARQALNIELIIHMDPLDFNDPRLNDIAQTLKSISHDLEGASFHDLRLIESHYRTNVIFDFVIPRDNADQKDQIHQQVNQAFKALDPSYHPMINFEYSHSS